MPKRFIAPLVNGRVRLRLLDEADLPMTLAWRNQNHIREWFLCSDVITPEQHRAWFDQYKDRDDDFVFIVEETQTLRRPVGQASIYHVDRDAGRAEFGRLMIGDTAAHGLGLGRLATARLVAEAHDVWNLREVYLECRAGNTGAIRIYRECNFDELSRDDRVVRMAHWKTAPAARD